MKKVTIKLSTAGDLDYKYKKLIEGLVKISSYDSIISRKDNDNICTEKEIYEKSTYTITSEFTPDEIKYLEKNYNIEILK